MLTEKELKEIRSLQQICEKNDNIHLKLNWDMLENRDQNNQEDFFYYEKNELVGYLALYTFGKKMELCGMVHPKNRRMGIFSNLFQQALTAIRTADNLLINAPAKSIAAKGFLQSIPCNYSFSEYQMKWEEKELKLTNKKVTLLKATEEHLPLIIQLDKECFSMVEQDAIALNKRILEDGTQPTYMIQYLNKLIGKIRIQREPSESYFYGFAVSPEFQGRGIGRNALMQAVLYEWKNGVYNIFLEVATENEQALALYTKCGFKTYETQDYYDFDKTKQ